MVAAKKPNLKKSTDTSTADSAPPITTGVTYMGPIDLRISDRKGLASLLTTLSTVADHKSTMPILGTILLRTGIDGTTLAATDLDVSATYRAPAWLGGKGGMCINARHLNAVVKGMPRNDVEIRNVDQGIVVTSGKSQAHVIGIPDRDFPRLPDDHDERIQWSMVSTEALRTVLQATTSAACLDETRFHLCCVALSTSGGYLAGCATDGHRLHRARAASSWRLERGVLVPLKAVKLLLRVLGAGACEIGVYGPHMFVRYMGWTLALKLIDAQFPPHEQIIPKDHNRFVTLARRTFVAALERAKVYATDVRGVHLKTDGSDLVIQADNPDTGRSTERIALGYDVGDMVIGANVRYLVEALKVIDDDSITFSVKGELEPMLVRGSEDMGTRSIEESALLIVIMPMRI